MTKLTKRMVIISAMLVAAFGIIMLYRNFIYPGKSFTADKSNPNSSAAVSAVTEATVNNGTQNITTVLTSNGYPNIKVQKDVPVGWNFRANSNVLDSCNSTLVISEYGIREKLNAGDNIRKFTPGKSGTESYSCSMGMTTGKIVVVDYLNS